MIKLDIKGNGLTQEDTRNILLYFNLEHWLRITQNDKVTILKPNDILLFNSKSAHTVECTDGLYVRCEIDLLELKSLFPGKRLRFLCDSTADQGGNYDLLRNQLKKLLRSYYEPDEFHHARVAQESYGLLLVLASNYMISQVDLKESSDAEALADYIDQNYREELSLKQISAAFHMTPQYFSKYFKQTLGVNFFKYLSKIRVEHAVELLLSTDEQVLQIAISSGFPNGESFYRTFQETYHTTPQEYRLTHRQESEQSRENQRSAWKKALSMLNAQTPAEDGQALIMELDSANGTALDPIWSRLINLGSFGVLRDSALQEQLGMLQEAIHYEYARITLTLHPTETLTAFLRKIRRWISCVSSS